MIKNVYFECDQLLNRLPRHCMESLPLECLYDVLSRDPSTFAPDGFAGKYDKICLFWRKYKKHIFRSDSCQLFILDFNSRNEPFNVYRRGLPKLTKKRFCQQSLWTKNCFQAIIIGSQ